MAYLFDCAWLVGWFLFHLSRLRAFVYRCMCCRKWCTPLIFVCRFAHSSVITRLHLMVRSRSASAVKAVARTSELKSKDVQASLRTSSSSSLPCRADQGRAEEEGRADSERDAKKG